MMLIDDDDGDGTIHDTRFVFWNIKQQTFGAEYFYEARAGICKNSKTTAIILETDELCPQPTS